MPFDALPCGQCVKGFISNADDEYCYREFVDLLL